MKSPLPSSVRPLLAAALGIDPETLPPELSAARGDRRQRLTIPANMVTRYQASEAAAWDHSPLAGILWEMGIRAALAIRWAELEKTVDETRPPA